MRLGFTAIILSSFCLFSAYAVNPASDLGVSYEEADVLYEYVNHWGKEERADFALANILANAGLALAAFGSGRVSRGQ